MAENLRLRHRIVRCIRRFLEDEHGFLEVGRLVGGWGCTSALIGETQRVLPGMGCPCLLSKRVLPSMGGEQAVRGAAHQRTAVIAGLQVPAGGR